MKTMWLSFCDPDKPEGEQFLGACVVDVTDEDAAEAKEELLEKFPRHLPGAEWVRAACRTAHLMGCNPGGEVGAWELPTDTAKVQALTRNRLLQKAELVQLGLVERIQ